MSSPATERLRQIFVDAVKALSPRRLCAERVAELVPAGSVCVLAAGKAAVGMAAGARAALGDARVHGVVVAPAAAELPPFDVLVAAHPRPDERSVAAARAVLARAREPEADHILALVSGGASALLCAPPEGITLAEKLAVVDAVMAGGAPIQQLNAVRKHLSVIKGGRLAACSPVPVTTLVISDVVGDDLATVGSGPTLPDPSTRADARAAIERYAGLAALPPSVARHLAGDGAESSHERRPGDQVVLLAGLAALVDRAAALAGHDARVVDRAVTGEVGDVADAVLGWIDAAGPGELLLAAGEPTVRVPAGAGVGGRATQLALLLARRLDGRGGVTVLVAGSDGVDGSSHAAGAIVDGGTWARVPDGDAALAGCDAATALGHAGALVVTGRTGVNHADLIAIAVGG